MRYQPNHTMGLKPISVVLSTAWTGSFEHDTTGMTPM